MDRGRGFMRIIKAEDYDHMSKIAADFIGAEIMLKPDAVLGLATGSTPVGTYKYLSEMVKAGEISFKEVRTFNLDEYEGLTASDPCSYAFYMKEKLFEHIDILPENTHIPSGTASDGEKECAGYDAMIDECGGIDLQLLGLGHNGHIGFNEPGNSFITKTHRVELTESTLSANRHFFHKEEDIPGAAYTLGMGGIFCSKRILLLVFGKEKAEILYEAFHGPVTPLVPSSLLQLHRDVVLVADKAALALFD